MESSRKIGSVILSIPLELSNWLIEELQPVAILVLFSSNNCPFIMVLPSFFTIGNDFHDFFLDRCHNFSAPWVISLFYYLF